MSKQAVAPLSQLLGPQPPYITPETSPSAVQYNEQIKSYGHFLLELPECAEKSLGILRAHIGTHIIAEKPENAPMLLTQEQMIGVFDRLKLQLKEEQLQDRQVSVYLGKITNLLNKPKLQYDDLSNVLFSLMKYIQPVDLDYILQVVDKTKEATGNIKDKDIILLLGGTGAGKSTTIHFLSGSTMVMEQLDGFEHIAPQSYDKSLETFTTSPYARSETKTINSINIEIEKPKSSEKIPFILCDTPGFGDTDGFEQDIANGLLLVNAVKECHSVKPIVLVNRDSLGARLDGLPKLAKTLSTFMRSEHKYEPISYLFTKYPKDKSLSINAQISNSLKCLNAELRSNTDLVDILKDMQAKTSSGAMVLDPLHDKPSDFLSFLSDGKNVMNPGEYFHNFTTEEALDKLKLQLIKSEKSFTKALQHGQVDIATYKLRQIVRLKNQLPLVEVDKTYTNMMITLKESIALNQEYFQKALTKMLKADEVEFESNMLELQKGIHFLFDMEPLSSQFLPESSNLRELMQIYLSNFLRDLKTKSIGGSTNSMNELPEYGYNYLNQWKRILGSDPDFFAQVPEFYKKMQDDYQEIGLYLSAMAKQSYASAKQAKTLDEFVIHADTLALLTDKYKDHLDNDALGFYQQLVFETNAYYVALCQGLTKELDLSVAVDKRLYQYRTINTKLISKALEELSIFYTTKGIKKHCDFEALKNLILQAEDQILNYFDVLQEHIIPGLWQHHQDDYFKKTAEILKTLEELLKSPKVHTVVHVKYYTLVQMVKDQIQDLKIKACNDIQQLSNPSKNDADSIIYDRLYCNVRLLHDASQCLDGFVPAIYQEEYQEVCLLMLAYVNKIELTLSNLDLSLSTGAKWPSLFLQSIKHLKALSALDQYMFYESSKSNLLLTQFEEKIRRVLSEIEKNLKDNTFFQNTEVLIHSRIFLTTRFESLPKDLEQRISILDLDSETAIVDYLDASLTRLNELYTLIVENAPFGKAIQVEDAENMISILLFLHKLRSDYQNIVIDYNNISSEQSAKLKKFFEDLPASILDANLASDGLLGIHIEKLVSLISSVESGQYDDSVYTSIQIASIMKSLDKLLPSTVPCNYAEVSSRLEGALKLHSKDKLHELNLLAAQNNFLGFKKCYESILLNQSELKTKANDVLLKQIDLLLLDWPKLKKRIEDIKFETHPIEELNLVFKEISRYIAFTVLKDLDSSGAFAEFMSKTKDIDGLINNRINQFIMLIDAKINHNELLEAWGHVNYLGILSNLFPTAKGQNRMLSIQSQLKLKIQNKALHLNESYMNLKITDFHKNPPIFHLDLLEQLSTEDKYFKTLHTQLSETLVDQIKGTIAECNNDQTEMDIEQTIKLISSLKSYIPSSLVVTYQDDLNKLEEVIEKNNQETKLFIENDTNNQKLQKAIELFNQCKYPKQISDIANYILRKMNALSANYKQSINQGDIGSILEQLDCSFGEWNYFLQRLYSKKIVIENKVMWDNFTYKSYKYVIEPSIVENIIKDIIKTCLSAYKKIFLSFNNLSNKKIKSDDALTRIAKDFANLCALLKLAIDNESNYQKTNSMYEKLVKSDPLFAKKELVNQFDLIGDYFVRFQNKFSEYLNSMRFESVNLSMELIKNHTETLVTIQEFAQEYKSIMPKFSKSMSKLQAYSEMRAQLAHRLISMQNIATQKILENERAKSSNSLDRTSFYTEISAAYLGLKKVKSIATHVDENVVNITLLEKECQEQILKHLTEVQEEILVLLNRVPCDSKNTYLDLNTWYDNLRIAIKCFEGSNLSQESKAMLTKIDRSLEDKIKAYVESIPEQYQEGAQLQSLISLKMMSVYSPSFKGMIDKKINTLLAKVKQHNGSQAVAKLGIELNAYVCTEEQADQQGVPQMIISEHDAFKSYATELRNEKTLRFGIDYVLDKLKANVANDDLNTSKLKNSYESFEKTYWELVENGLLGVENAKEDIVKNAWDIANSDVAYHDKVIQLVANLFAYWTLMNSTEFNNEEESDLNNGGKPANNNYLLQPHSAQVTSIFRLLGIDVKKGDPLKNQLVEIGTGEGKSVTMAITASVLAFLGYDVNCACYSDYLSQRDYEDFATLFEKFELIKYINYGTFNKLCENLINQRGDVRQRLLELMNKKTFSPLGITTKPRIKVILVDEVDVFFSEDFYGNFYRPLAELEDDTVYNLLEYIWKNRNNQNELILKNIMSTAVYKACCMRFADWDFLIQEAVKAMIIDVKSFEQLDYVVQNDRIGYRDQHGVTFNISYRYKTIFAYFCEQGKGQITSGTLKKRANLLIDCGTFSYAEIPNQFKYIFGVTGTLSTLSKPEKELLEKEYAIKKFTYMPSVYGENQRKFAGDSSDDVIIVKRDAYFLEIANEIKRRSTPPNGEPLKRSVLVPFDSYKQLSAFYLSSEFKKLGIDNGNVRIISEELNEDQKRGLIQQANSAGSVTLFTKSFCRGTDFKIFDRRVEACGGAHETATFVSDDLSGEVQMMGRIARQGDRGSFSMVLAAEDLERYGLKEDDIKRMKDTKSLYTTLNKARCDFFMKAYAERMRCINDGKEEHNKAMKFVTDLFAENINDIKSYLLKQNETHLSVGNARTICLMDATGSMSSVIEKSKNTVQRMFERVLEILKEKGIQKGFEMMFVAYRNYNAPEEKLMEHSAWESDPSNLRSFLSTITASYGIDNEAIEIGLWKVNQELEKGDIAQVILIGDVPPNTNDGVRAGRCRKSESYWRNTNNYANPVYFESELQKIISKGIPVHAFDVHVNAISSFRQIAKATGGQSDSLDIDSPEGAERLMQVVAERILDNLGGSSLVDSYRSKYGVKGHTAPVSSNSSSFFAGQNSNSVSVEKHKVIPVAGLS